MQIVVLIAFILVLMPLDVPGLAAEGRWVPTVVIYFLGAIALGVVNARISLRGLDRGASLPAATMRRHNALSLFTQVWLLGGLGALIVTGYAAWVLEDTWVGGVPLLGELAILGPFVAALILTWLLDYPFYRAVRRRISQQQAQSGLNVRTAWGLGEYLAYNTRHHLLFVAVPIGIIILIMDALYLYAYPALHEDIRDFVVGGGTLAGGVLVLLVAPLLISRIWKTRPLPSGALRTRLEVICRRLKLRYRDILIWESGGVIANAGVMGFVGPLRYVLLSDALIEHMDAPHIESVFAHEAGHIISHHIPYSVIFCMVTVGLCWGVGELLAHVLTGPPWSRDILILTMWGGTWAVVFGWLSRRFERQCDVTAAWATGREGEDPEESGKITPEGAAIFAQAMDRVARLNGIPAHQHSWRHGSIANRISYVLWLGGTGGSREKIDRTVRRIKISLWVALVLAAGLTAVTQILFPGD